MTNPVAKIGDLGQIKRLKKELDRRVQEQSDKVAAELAEERVREQCKELFKTAVGAIHPLRAPERKRLEPSLPPPIPTQRQLDELAVVREALSDEWDASSLLNTDEALSFRRPGVGVDVLRKLRQGVWSVQAHLDLHRLRTDEARNALAAFIRESHKLGMRCVRVVHGKGWALLGKSLCCAPKCKVG